MKSKIQYIYQLGIRYPSNKEQKFIIEREMLISDRKFTSEDAQLMSEKTKTDVLLTYIGVLTPTTEKKAHTIEITRFKKEDIQKYIDKWNKGDKKDGKSKTETKSIQ